jgi:hypothetical protein
VAARLDYEFLDCVHNAVQECPWYCDECVSDTQVTTCTYEKDNNYIPVAMVAIGVLFVAVSWLLSFAFAVWTIKYHTHAHTHTTRFAEW